MLLFVSTFLNNLGKKSQKFFLVVYLQSPKKFFVGTYKVLDEIHTFSCSLPTKSQKFLCWINNNRGLPTNLQSLTPTLRRPLATVNQVRKRSFPRLLNEMIDSNILSNGIVVDSNVLTNEMVESNVLTNEMIDHLDTLVSNEC